MSIYGRHNVGPQVHCFEQKPRFDYVNTTCQTRTFLNRDTKVKLKVMCCIRTNMTTVLKKALPIDSYKYQPCSITNQAQNVFGSICPSIHLFAISRLNSGMAHDIGLPIKYKMYTVYPLHFKLGRYNYHEDDARCTQSTGVFICYFQPVQQGDNIKVQTISCTVLPTRYPFSFPFQYDVNIIITRSNPLNTFQGTLKDLKINISPNTISFSLSFR